MKKINLKKTKKWFKTLGSVLFQIFIFGIVFSIGFTVLFILVSDHAKLYLTLAFFGCIAFCPLFVALKRGHKNKKAIGALTFFLTLIWLLPIAHDLLTTYRVKVSLGLIEVCGFVLLIWALWPGCETRWTLRSKTKYPGLITDNEKVA